MLIALANFLSQSRWRGVRRAKLADADLMALLSGEFATRCPIRRYR